MIRINLLPVRAMKKKRTVRQMVSVILLSSGLVVLIMVFFHLSLSSQIATTEDQIKHYREEIARLKVETKDVEKYKAEREVLQRRLNIIASLERARTGPVRLLDELTQSLPGKLWLTSLKEKEGKLELKGVAMDNQTIAKFMTNLEKVDFIKSVELVVSQQIEKKEVKLKEFTLTCQLQYGGLPREPAS
jgi:type IV pilus assembly protein PilN